MIDDFHKSILILSVLVTLLVFISFFTSPPGPEGAAASIIPYAMVDSGLEPDISADSAAVVRLNSGQVLFAKNSDKFSPIASITKLMTAVIFLEHADLFDLVEITYSAKKPSEDGEKMSPIPAGEFLKAEDILKLMLIDSYNDIARASAEYASVRGVGISFADLMNKKAEEIGMSNSRFDNPAGLDSIENYSTAEDLAKLVSYVTKNRPRIWDVSRIYETDIFSKSGNKYHLINTNQLLQEITDIVGSKTGSTDGAKESLALVVNILKNDPVVFIILRSDDRIKDVKTLIAWVKIVYGI